MKINKEDIENIKFLDNLLKKHKVKLSKFLTFDLHEFDVLYRLVEYKPKNKTERINDFGLIKNQFHISNCIIFPQLKEVEELLSKYHIKFDTYWPEHGIRGIILKPKNVILARKFIILLK